MKARIVPGVVTALMLLLASQAWAGAPTERLRTFFDQANTIIQAADPERGLDEPRAALRALVNDAVDLREAAAQTLGREWAARTPQEQQEFVRLFADLLVRGFVTMVGAKIDTSGSGFTTTFVSESVQGETATVTTTMLTRSGSDLAIDYRMGLRAGLWMVQDATIDGVSLVGNYRAQVQRVMQTSSYADLVAQMREKVADSPPSAAPTQTARVQPGPFQTVATDEPPAPTGGLQPSAPAETSAPTAGPLFVGPAAAAPIVASAPPTRLDAPPSAPAEQPAATDSAPPTPAERPAAADSAPPTPALQPVSPIAPPAPAPAAASAKTRTVQRASYWIQVGAFRNAEAATRLAQQIRTASTRVATIAADPVVRVRVGPFAQRSQALVKLKELEKKGYRGFIVAEARE